MIDADEKIITSDALTVIFKEDDVDVLNNELYLITGLLKTKEIKFIPNEYQVQLDLLNINGELLDNRSTYVSLKYVE